MTPPRPSPSWLLALAWALSGCLGVVTDVGSTPETTPPPQTGENPSLPNIPSVPLNLTPTVTAFTADPQTGNAPLPITFRFTANDPEGAALDCALDVEGDGRAERQGNCATELSYSQTFATPGTFTARLRVADEQGASVERTLSYEVKERPNAAPEIATFAVAPAQGAIPLATAFTFEASDPEQGALTCTLDVNADGTAEYSFTACKAVRQAHTFAAAGTFTAVLTVKDEKGATAEKRLTVTAKAPVGDVRISKVEWGQSVFKTDLRLVEGKAALLRVHVLGDRANIAGVTVKAEAVKGGTVLGAITLVGPATPPTAENPADLTASFRGVVPEAFVTPGVEVRIQVDPADALPETNEDNNALTVTPAVGAGTVMHMTAVPVVLQGTTGAIPSFEAAVLRQWPIKQVDRTNRAPFTYTGTIAANDGNAWSALLQAIAALRQSDGSARYYYGFVRLNYTAGIFGIGYISQPAATGSDRSVDTYVHELGHNLSRRHAPCGGVAGPDPQYPYAGARLGSYGYDSAAATPALMLKAPGASFDLMSYCDPVWISDYNYLRAQAYLESNPPGAAIVAGDDVPAMLVTGRVTPQGVVLSPVQRFMGRVSTLDEAGPLTVLAVTREGRQLTWALPLMEVAEGGEQHFVATLPDLGVLSRVEVQLDGATVAGREALPAAPFDARLQEEAGVLTLTWNPKAHPWAMVAHVSKAGERTTLGLWLEGGSATLPVEGLPEGGSFDISLSDGVNSERARLWRR